MSASPETYSGRGVDRTDLGVPHLKAIHRGLISEFGEEAGKEFCLMIESLNDLSATNFLNQFFYFFDSGKVWNGGITESGVDVGPDDDTQARMAIGFATIASAMFSGQSTSQNSERSLQLKWEFFDAIKYEPTNACEKPTVLRRRY